MRDIAVDRIMTMAPATIGPGDRIAMAKAIFERDDIHHLPVVDNGVHGTAGPWRSTLFSGYEGALRVPFAMRWPGKIEAGRASDEIVHAMDLFPSLATIAGGEVPDDRVIDGIDVSGFLLGDRPESGRDGFVVYMGNDIFAVK